MPLIRYIQKITRDPNFLVWRDTVYINADSRPQYLSLKLISNIDKLLQGKISEYIFQTEFKEVRLSCDEIRVLGRNLVFEYLFYEGNGNVLHDTSGYGRHCTIYGAIWKQLTNGKWYLEYDGVDDYVELSSTYALNTNKITMQVVFRVDDIRTAIIFAFIVGGEQTGIWFKGLTSKICYEVRQHSSKFTYIEGSTLSINKWYDAVLIANAEKKIIKGYLNGVLDAQGTLPDNTNIIGSKLFFSLKQAWASYFKGATAIGRVILDEVDDTIIQKLHTLAQIAVPELGQ